MSGRSIISALCHIKTSGLAPWKSLVHSACTPGAAQSSWSELTIWTRLSSCFKSQDYGDRAGVLPVLELPPNWPLCCPGTFRSVTNQTSDSRWVTKEPATDISLHVVGKTGGCTIPSNWSISNNKSTVWKLPLIVEGQLTTLSLLPLWHHWRLTWILHLASLLIYNHSDPLITWLNYRQFIIMKSLTITSFVSFRVIFHQGDFQAWKIQHEVP